MTVYYVHFNPDEPVRAITVTMWLANIWDFTN